MSLGKPPVSFLLILWLFQHISFVSKLNNKTDCQKKFEESLSMRTHIGMYNKSLLFSIFFLKFFGFPY